MGDHRRAGAVQGADVAPYTVEYVNGSAISISGGVPGRTYRVSITYTQDTPAW